MKQYSIKQAAAALELSEVYIRRMIQQKKIVTVKVMVNESVWKHMIDESELNRWRKQTSTRSIRSDNRNKYNLYATEAELAEITKLLKANKIESPIERANKPEDIKRRYVNQKIRKQAAKAAKAAK
jgi:hypothetical protein